MEQWKEVAWFDGSRLLLHHLDVRVRTRRLRGEETRRRQAGGQWLCSAVLAVGNFIHLPISVRFPDL